MKKVVLIFILTLSLCLISCDFPPNMGYNGKDQYPYISIVLVSAFASEDNFADGGLAVIESDDYGRTLFSFQYSTCLVQPFTVYGYGICQKEEGGYAYYYDDCWYTYSIDLRTVSYEDIELLKIKNDWNKETVDSKTMAKVKVAEEKTDKNLFGISEADKISVCEMFAQIQGIEFKKDDIRKRNIGINSSSRDSNGKTLYYIFTENGEKVFPRWQLHVFAVIVDANGHIGENGIIEIDNIYDAIEEINLFKQANSWSPIT